MNNESMVCSWCNRPQALHHPTCPRYPEFGYDKNGVPHTESQIGKAFEAIGREHAERINKAVLQEITG